MAQITAEQVNKDNTNLRKFSDELWRALRKERFKKADPDKFVNQMAAEQLSFQSDPHSNFRKDIETFMATKLSPRRAKIFSLFVFGGKIGQADIGKILGVSQATVANDLKASLSLFKTWYFADGDHGYDRKTIVEEESTWEEECIYG